MANTRLKPLDAVWLLMESQDTPMHVGVLAIFQTPGRADSDYLLELANNMREAGKPVAPWNAHLANRRDISMTPTLIEERDFDLDYHFRHSALPLPGGERELGIEISRLHSQALDRGRPLWELHLLEGLERNRFAFYLKIHHALIDNVNGIPLMLSMLSESAKHRQAPPLWTIQPPSAEHAGLSGPGSMTQTLDSLDAMGKATAGFFRSLLNRSGEGSFLAPFGTPRSTLNRHINAQRRFATQQFESARIEKLAAATDSTLNEILTYLCSSSLRRFFKEYNALPEQPLVGALPVSLQERSESLPGNAITGLRVALGTHIGDPLLRLEAIKSAMKEVREDRESLPEGAVTSYVLTRSAPLLASQVPRLGRVVPPLFNLGISNTPGPESPLYLNGARLEAIYPLSQLMQFSALSIDCVGYDGTLNIGFTGARDTLPHLQRLAVYVGKAAADLEALLQVTEAEQ